MIVADCPCAHHCLRCSSCGPLNDQQYCKSCLTPLYRWVPACSTCHAEVAAFTALSEQGECGRCFIARMASPVGCTQSDHDAIKADDSLWLAQEWKGLWPDTELALVNCTACRSTLARETTDADIQFAYSVFVCGWARLGCLLEIHAAAHAGVLNPPTREQVAA